MVHSVGPYPFTTRMWRAHAVASETGSASPQGVTNRT